MNDNDTKELFSQSEAADFLGVTYQTVKTWTNNGILVPVREKPRIYRREDLQRVKDTRPARGKTLNGEDKHLLAVRLDNEGWSHKEIADNLGYKNLDSVSRAIAYGKTKLAAKKKKHKR